MKKNRRVVLLVTIVVAMVLSAVIVYLVFNSKPKQAYNEWHEVLEATSKLSKNESKVLKTKGEFDEYVKNYDSSLKLDLDNLDYLLVSIEVDSCSEELTDIRDVKVEDNKINLSIGYEAHCGVCAPTIRYFLVPFDKGMIKDSMEVKYTYIKEKAEHCDPMVVKKPIIYLYPEKDMNINIKLGYEDKLYVSYPKYNKGWNVFAKTNGDLIDLDTNKKYYGLYWEGKNSNSNKVREEGFVVKGEDAAKFLEEKLAILGLNEREANEFIIYWLPKLESNKYNYIYFETMDEINENMPLIVEPQPKTVIRVVMEFKGLDNPIDVKEEKLEAVTRSGYTLVEWGGTELN